MSNHFVFHFIIFIMIFPMIVHAGEVKMVKIKKGPYTPFFEKTKNGKKSKVIVTSFFMDITPVTNEQYLEFVKANPSFKRSQIKNIFAEDSYLRHWTSDTSYLKKDKNKPIRNVSWFAALSYCESLGKELPTVLQWEYVGSANEKIAFAIGSLKYKEKILRWYSKPNVAEISDVGQGVKNYWGVYDMHGLQWEWNQDFNSSFVTGESREDTILNRNKFCGSGSLNAKDKLDYGAFMRFGFRSSLKGNYAIGNLGFRCVKNIGKK